MSSHPTPTSESTHSSTIRKLSSPTFRSMKSAPVTPLRSSMRSTCGSPTISPTAKTVGFVVPCQSDLKWRKDLISEFNLAAPKLFDYKTSYVRTAKELSTKRDNMTSADFWPRRQKLDFIKRYNLSPLIRKKLARNPIYELRLIARLSQPAAPFQMDRRTSLLIQDRKTSKDFKLMNNNEDPWMFIRPNPMLIGGTTHKPSMDDWANHPMYRPASAVDIRFRKRLKQTRQNTMDAFIEAVEIEEHKAALAEREKKESEEVGDDRS